MTILLMKYKKMIHDLGSRQNGVRNRSDVSSSDILKSCCHHSLRDVCVHTDSAWWRLKKYCHQKDIGNYSDGFIICLNSFLYCVHFAIKKIHWLHGVFTLLWFAFFSQLLRFSLTPLICTCLLVEYSFLFSKQVTQAHHLKSMKLSLSMISYFHVNIFYIGCLSFLKQHGNVSHLKKSKTIDKDPMKRYRAVLDAAIINWGSFVFNGKSVKLNMSMILLVHIYYCWMGLFFTWSIGLNLFIMIPNNCAWW